MHLPWAIRAADMRLSILTSITDEESARLRELAAGRDVLEIGSAYGYSACIMALAGARHVTAIDPHAWLDSHAAMLANLAACGVQDKVTVIREAAADVLPRMTPLGFDLVFVDGDHAYDAVLADVKGVLPLIRPGGMLACHDYGEDCCCPGVRQALDELFPDGPAVLTGTLFQVAA